MGLIMALCTMEGRFPYREKPWRTTAQCWLRTASRPQIGLSRSRISLRCEGDQSGYKVWRRPDGSERHGREALRRAWAVARAHRPPLRDRRRGPASSSRRTANDHRARRLAQHVVEARRPKQSRHCARNPWRGLHQLRESRSPLVSSRSAIAEKERAPRLNSWPSRANSARKRRGSFCSAPASGPRRRSRLPPRWSRLPSKRRPPGSMSCSSPTGSTAARPMSALR